jgi:hypothetical protein
MYVQNVFSYYRMCSLTIECVLLLYLLVSLDEHQPRERNGLDVLAELRQFRHVRLL